MPFEIADRWFDFKRLDDGISHIWEPHVIPLMRCNIWHVRGRDRDMIVDTGMGVVSLRDAISHLIDKPVTAAATHAHQDHVGSHYEFDDCLVHRLEHRELEKSSWASSLYLDNQELLDELAGSGYRCDLGQCYIDALPYEGYDPGAYELKGTAANHIVEEGDIVDLGDRRFEILHIPGHSPGSIGLWEEASGILFSGDCIYDGPLLDRLSGSNIADYITSMKRLRDLPVRVVHAGHDPSFGRERLVELVDEYLKLRDV
jgi:glyoxylase-like metal-dependent hydrolase (beta-lactamase superfamily II)